MLIGRTIQSGMSMDIWCYWNSDFSKHTGLILPSRPQLTVLYFYWVLRTEMSELANCIRNVICQRTLKRPSLLVTIRYF